MYLAMYRFRIAKGQRSLNSSASGPSATLIWARSRGLANCHLLKGPETEDHTLYASHTTWEFRGHFEDWTKSEVFRAAHGSAGGAKDVYLGPPQFEGFEAVQAFAKAGS